MKITLISGAVYSIPSINFFCGNKMIHRVVSFGGPNKHSVPVEHTALALGVPFKRFLKNELKTGFREWLTAEQPDLVLVFGCAYKIPEELFTIPKLGFYNIHFSLLPAYRGRNPLFWQLKNGEQVGGITIHKMVEGFDAGPILIQKEMQIFPGENHGLLSGRLSLASVSFIDQALFKLEKENGTALTGQNEDALSYAPEPTVNDLRINWETQSAKEIENLVNATNPDYGGAITLFRGQLFRIFEVSPAELPHDTVYTPGTIVHSDVNYGVFVACKDSKFLKIGIAQLPEGYLSGFKLAQTGIAAGECFQSAPDLTNICVQL